MRFLKAFFLHSTDRISPALPAFVSLWAILFLAGLTVRSVLSPALFVLLYLFYARTGRAQIRVWYLLLSLFFGISALLVEGPRISSAFSSGLFRAAALLITAAGLVPLFYRLIDLASDLLQKLAKYDSPEGASFWKLPVVSFISRHLFLCTFLILVLLWLPYYLYEYPGILSPDGIVQMEQVFGVRPLSNHHPVFHTMFMAIFYRLGQLFTDSKNAALSFYTMAQLLFHAFCCACVVRMLQRLRLHPLLIAAAFAFYALIPYHAVFAVYSGKDTPFADAFMLFLCALSRLVFPEAGYGKARDRFLFVLTGILMCLLRSNGWYAFLFLIPFLLIAFRSQLRQILVMCAIIVCVSVLVRGPLYGSLQVVPGDMLESLCVPLQQIGRTLTDGAVLPEEDMALIGKVVNHPEDIPTVYDPVFADMMKEIIRTNGDLSYLEAHKADYLRLYIRTGLAHPGSYVRGWVDLTDAYWYPDLSYEMAIIDGVADNSIGLSWTPVLRGMAFVKFKEIVLKLGTFMPLYGLIWSMGFIFWILLFFSAYLLTMKKQRRRLILLMPAISLYLTLFLAAPVAEFRYGYPMLAALPFYLSAVLPFPRPRS
ncbi:MAG: hypothetical protein J6M46_04760 [Lachnospiraceae bacterium]|nr:hypothetical protein [Lachnospiraceae bacterium]